MNQDELWKLLTTEEELDPELESYYEINEDGWAMIRHPLVYSVLHTENMNAMVNHQLKYKREAVAKAEDEQRWYSYLFLHERPYRVEAFEAIQLRLTDEEYWKLLRDIWVDTENIWQNQTSWWRLMISDRPGRREHMMTEEERAALDQDFDERITVYRGYHPPGGWAALSWTTNSITAKFFARRLAITDEQKANMRVAEGVIHKENVIAFLNGRGEEEIVLLPEELWGTVHIEHLPR